ncbi:ribbon-helix-helix domain-containing protein [Methanohalobium sp.]|nr:ribbon-helix-helix domain-containing protein [Methanohalobium sp.]
MKTSFTTYLPVDLVKRVRQESKDTDRPQTEIVEEALMKYFEEANNE